MTYQLTKDWLIINNVAISTRHIKKIFYSGNHLVIKYDYYLNVDDGKTIFACSEKEYSDLIKDLCEFNQKAEFLIC